MEFESAIAFGAVLGAVGTELAGSVRQVVEFVVEVQEVRSCGCGDDAVGVVRVEAPAESEEELENVVVVGSRGLENVPGKGAVSGGRDGDMFHGVGCPLDVEVGKKGGVSGWYFSMRC